MNLKQMSIRDRNRKMFCFDEIEDALDELRSTRNLETRANAVPKSKSLEVERDRAISAMKEIRGLWDYVTKEASRNYSKMYSKLTFPISDEIERQCQRHKENFAVYDRVSKKWLVKSNEPTYEYFYDGEKFVEFKFVKKLRSVRNRFLLVGKYTILRQEPNLLEKTRSALQLFNNFSLPTLKLIVGVPGCGKTSYIIKTHRPGSLVLTSCAEGAEDIRTRMATLRRTKDPDEYRGSYRTIDSYLLNSRNNYGTVWMDEALMEHPGKLFLVCLFSGCRTLYLLGDPNQLGYINRVEAVNLLYDKSSTFFKATNTLNISYRCPVDVMAVLSNKYDGGAYSTSDVMRSMECQKFTGLDCVPRSNKVKYLVFKQAEKQQLRKAKYDVSTIHEFQGKEADRVIIVRMSRNLDESLYKSVPHMLVGISRHRQSLVYYTPVTDDLKKLIETPLTLRDLNRTKKVAK